MIESSGVIQSLTEAKKIFVLTNQIRAVREMLDLFGLDRVSLETIQNMSEPDEEGTICFCAGAGSKEDHTFWTLTWTGGTIEMG
ncbi:hypothetical protein KJ903_01165 [Patescibacteria group bacterium]|nr:hypothetical protein [Patescibacteria group bacterium]